MGGLCTAVVLSMLDTILSSDQSRDGAGQHGAVVNEPKVHKLSVTLSAPHHAPIEQCDCRAGLGSMQL